MGTYYESYYNSAYNVTYNSDGSTTYYNSAYNTSTNDTYGSTSYYNSAYNTDYNSDGSTSYYNSAYSTSYNDTYGSTTYYNSAYSTSSGYSSTDYSSYYTDYYTSTYTPSSSSTYYSSYTPSYYSTYSSSYRPSYTATYTPYSSSSSSSSYKSTSSYSPSSSSSSSYSSSSGSSGIGKGILIVLAAMTAFGMLMGIIMSIVTCAKDSKVNKVLFTVEQVENGSLTIPDAKFSAKEPLTFTATPDAGYFLAYTLVFYEGRENDDYHECVDGDILLVFGNEFVIPFGGKAKIVPVFRKEGDDSPILIGEKGVEYDAAYYFYGKYTSSTKKVYRNIYVYGLKTYLDSLAGGYPYAEMTFNMEVAENEKITYEDSKFFGQDQTNSKQVITSFNFVNNVFSMEKQFELDYATMDHAGKDVSSVYSAETATLKFPWEKLSDQIFIGFAIDEAYGNTDGFDPSIAWKFRNMSVTIAPVAQ